MAFAFLCVAPKFPKFVINTVFTSVVAFAIWVGNHFALNRLERLGFQSQAKEIRIFISRVKPKFAVDLDVPNFFNKYKPVIIFAAIWLICFGVFYWLGRGFANWGDIQTNALAALMTAIVTFVVVVYLFPQSQLIQSLKRLLNNMWGSADADYVKYVPWTCVSKIREVRNWNFKNELTGCQFLFVDEKEILLLRANVPPEFYGTVFHQIEARLENPHISVEYSNHTLV